ncbi:MAG: cyclic nucleotide-binding domain-containing protein [Phaeodactylibacter sp.]|nr:cyclic nucleotide-binding domain-containing protein [Phaeodactylibacter sp.]
MIKVSPGEMEDFLGACFLRKFRRKEILSQPFKVPQEIFFINSGIIRVAITDNKGTEHTVHFAMENQFIADYSCFMQKKPSLYSLEALEDIEVAVLPRSAIEWGYNNGRLLRNWPGDK